MSSKDWYPEFVYEEGAKVPFVIVPVDQKMPEKIFVQEYKETGETELAIDEQGQEIEVPKCDMDICLYFSYYEAKKVLRPELLDELRTAFGLSPLKLAEEEGRQITERVLEASERNNKKS